MKRFVTSMVCILVTALAATIPAAADDSLGSPSVGSGNGTIYAGVSQPYSGGYRGQRFVCDWTFHDNTVAGGQVADPGYNLFYVTYKRHNCNNPANNAFVVVPLGTSEQLILPALQDYVVSQLPSPEPEITPLRKQGWVLVQVPMDFRVAPETWQPITASASLDGPESRFATVTATPVRLEVIPNDGRNPADRASCDGDEAIAPYEPETPGACSYTYRSSSATAPNGLEFPAEFLIHWDVTYITSDQPGVRTLTIEPTTTQRPIGVAEVKGFVTCVGSTCAE